MDTTKALQNLLNGTASEEDVSLLKHGLVSGEISIGGNVNQSVIIIGSGNTVELTPQALDRLGGRSLLGDLDRDLTGDEIAIGLSRLETELPLRAPILLTQLQEQTRRLRPSLKTNPKSLSDHARRERVEALAQVNSLCIEALDISFNALCLGEEPPEYDSRSPFRGLESFRPEDSEFFFGREAMTKKLVDKIKSHPFLAVLGASGSGKSSLVMAGLIPALGSEYLIFRPGAHPLEALELAKENALIVVDQFEELFTLTRDEATRKEYIAKLLETSKRNKVVITLRSDFLGEVAAYRNLNDEVQSHLENVPPMDMDELRRAMEGQASVVGLRFEADLSQQILDDVEGEPGAMPLLQHALWELWNRRHGRNLRASDYRAFGGVKQAITSTAEKVYGECIKAEQEQVRDIFLRLTRLDDSDEGRDTRRRVAINDLIPSGRDTASVTLLLDKLANARLVVKTVNEDTTEIEVAHEALIRYWERLRGWLNEDRDNLQLRESVNESAKEWENSGKHESLLNSRWVKLDEALLLAQGSRYRLTEIEQSYLKACVALRNREQQERERRLRVTVFASIVAAVIFLTLGSFGLVKSNQAADQARIALGRQLAVQAQSLNATFSSKQMIATLLSIQSLKLLINGDAASILINANDAAPLIVRMEHDSQVLSVTFSPSGEYVASGSLDGTVRVWKTASGKEVIRITQDTSIRSVAFSPNEKYVVTGSEDGNAQVWEVISGKEVSRMAHDDSVVSVSFSLDGLYVVSGSKDHTARVWEAISGKEIARMTHDNAVYSVAFSPDRQYIVSGGWDNTARVWQTANGKEVARMTHDYYVETVAFSPNGHYVVSGSLDYTARVWEASSGKEISRMTHDDWVKSSVAFSPDGQFVVSGSYDNTARVWEAVSGKELARMTHDSSVEPVAFSPDGRYVVSGSSDGTARVWEVVSGKEVVRMTHDGMVNSVVFSPDSHYVVSGSSDGTARVWEVVSGKEVVSMNHDDILETVAFLPGSQYVVSGSHDNTARIWNVFSGKEVARMTHDDAIGPVTYSTDSQYVVSGGWDTTARVWQTANGKELARMTHDDVVTSIAFSPDGHYVVSGSLDNTARVWEASSGKEISRMTHDDVVDAVAFSPDGQYVISGSYDGTARIWVAANGREVAQLLHDDYMDLEFDSSVVSVTFSPGGKYAATGSWDNTARVWEVVTGKEVARMTHDGKVNSVAFSPDSRYVVSGSSDGTARVWEAVTGKEVARMTHNFDVYSVAFNPSGDYVVSGSFDNTARVWEAASSKEVARIVHDNSVISVDFSPDGKYVVSGSYDRTVRVWKWQRDDLIESACKVMPRNLTRAEWQQFIGDALPYQAICPNLPLEPESTSIP